MKTSKRDIKAEEYINWIKEHNTGVKEELLLLLKRAFCTGFDTSTQIECGDDCPDNHYCIRCGAHMLNFSEEVCSTCKIELDIQP